MRHTNIIITLFLLFATLAVSAQDNYSPCYRNNMSKGDAAYDQGRYSEARTYYANAKQCAGGNPTEAQRKISACDTKLRAQQEAEARRRAEQKVSCRIEPMSVASVYSESGRTLYGGITNKLYFTAPDMSSKYVVKIPNCEVKRNKVGEMNVVVPVSMVGRTITVSVQKEDGREVSSVEFRVIGLPDPCAIIGAGIRGGRCSKSELTYLRAETDDNFMYDVTWVVDSFKVMIVQKNISEPTILCTGANFSDELKQKIAKLSPNSVVIFTDINVSCGDVRKKTLNEISVRIRFVF